MASWSSRFNEPVPIERAACFWIFSMLPKRRSRFSPGLGGDEINRSITQKEKVCSDPAQECVQKIAETG